MSQEKVEVVKGARSSRGDFDGVACALSLQGWNGSKPPHVPGAITHRGHAEVKRYFESMPRYGEELRSSPSDLLTTGMRFWPSLG